MSKSCDKPNGVDARAEQAGVLIDPRLAEIWAGLWSVADRDTPMDLIGKVLRLAYLTGYHDSTTESERGSLYSALGLSVPPRSKGAKSRSKGLAE